MCASSDSTHNLFTPPAPVPTPAHRPTPQQRAHPQSTMTKGKSWAQDIRLPLAARVCPAQSFLQIAAVWAKPPLCLLTIDGTWVGGVIISARSDQGGVGGLCLVKLVWLYSFTAGWTWSLFFFSFFFSQHNECVWLIFPTLKLNHMTPIPGNGGGLCADLK